MSAQQTTGGSGSLILLFLLIGGFISIMSIGGLALYYIKADIDGDDAPKIIDRGDNKGDSGDSKIGDTIVISGGVDLNDDGDYSDEGEIKPSNKATVEVVIKELYMDTVLEKGQRLYKKIFLLPPNTPFKEYVRLEARGGDVENVRVDFYLLQGILPRGALTHEVGSEEIKQDSVTIPVLREGESKLIELSGRTPEYMPGKDWYLGNVIVYYNDDKIVSRVNPRLDDPEQPRWLTLMYPKDWCYVTKAIDSRCIDVTFGDDGAWIEFSRGSGDVDRIKVYQITYPGKYVKVYDGELIPKNVPGAFDPLGAAQYIFDQFTGTYKIYIPYKHFASVEPNEAYLKMTFWSEDGRLIDVNRLDAKDPAARVNIDVEIRGGKTWTGNQEYFSVLGKVTPFSVMVEGHPESQWF